MQQHHTASMNPEEVKPVQIAHHLKAEEPRSSLEDVWDRWGTAEDQEQRELAFFIYRDAPVLNIVQGISRELSKAKASDCCSILIGAEDGELTNPDHRYALDLLLLPFLYDCDLLGPDPYELKMLLEGGLFEEAMLLLHQLKISKNKRNEVLKYIGFKCVESANYSLALKVAQLMKDPESKDTILLYVTEDLLEKIGSPKP